MALPNYVERAYVSQYEAGYDTGLLIHIAGILDDPDGNDVQVVMKDETETTTIFTRAATRESEGTYKIVLSSVEVQDVGNYNLIWTYEIGAVPQIYKTFIQVGPVSPEWDALHDSLKPVVEGVWLRFADLFDSPSGGPNLQTYYQTRWGRGRMTQLLGLAVMRINSVGQPHQTWTLDGAHGLMFPVEQYGGLLDKALYVEALKHLIRSYVEQPVAEVQGLSRLDRRDYMQRWQSVLEMEERDLATALDLFKISFLGLGHPHVLVSGGVYGVYAPTRYAGSAAARPRYYARFY